MIPLEQSTAFENGKRLRARVLQTKCLPPIPQTLLQLLEVIQKEKTSANELENVILRDQNLTAKVLQAANSAYYGYCGKISSVSRAVVAIGFHEIQSICLCALLMQHFWSEKGNRQEQVQLWQHSFATAGMARSISQLRPWITAEEGYILGLLHDLGRVVLMCHFPDEYLQIRNLAIEHDIPIGAAENQFGMPHTLIGKWLAIKWHLPLVFQVIMEYHHDPLGTSELHKEATLTCLANVLAHSEDLSSIADDDLINECCRQLYIANAELCQLGEKARYIRKEAINLVNMFQ